MSAETGQNISTAVMQRRVEAHDSLDDFPTQPWATRALMEHVIIPELGLVGARKLSRQIAWEPACNRGHMAKPLAEYFGTVVGSDIHDYGVNAAVQDFLFPGNLVPASWIITNPPFRLAEQFIERSFELATWEGTAVIVRTSFLEGVGRYTNLYSKIPPAIVAQFVERVPMVKGRLTSTGSTATSYCWLVWRKDAPRGTRLVWIPPCRRQLERAGDYA